MLTEPLLILFIKSLVDSSAAKGAITNGFSRSKTLTKMAGEIWLVADALQCGIIVKHVDTTLNPADPLSRGQEEIAISNGFMKVAAACLPPDRWRL